MTSPHQALVTGPDPSGYWNVECSGCGGVITFLCDTEEEAQEQAARHTHKHQMILDSQAL